jgi:hypothetical protein
VFEYNPAGFAQNSVGLRQEGLLHRASGCCRVKPLFQHGNPGRPDVAIDVLDTTVLTIVQNGLGDPKLYDVSRTECPNQGSETLPIGFQGTPSRGVVQSSRGGFTVLWGSVPIIVPIVGSVGVWIVLWIRLFVSTLLNMCSNGLHESIVESLTIVRECIIEFDGKFGVGSHGLGDESTDPGLVVFQMSQSDVVKGLTKDQSLVCVEDGYDRFQRCSFVAGGWDPWTFQIHGRCRVGG